MKRLNKYIQFPLFIPHILLFLLSRKESEEIKCWGKALRINKKGVRLFYYLILHFREYRTLFAARTRFANLLCCYTSGQPALYFDMPLKNIGQGLVIQHGHSTRINAEKIGRNCQIWHNVTIGKDRPGGG